MPEEQNKQVFRRLIEEGFSKGNLEALNDVFAPNFAEHQDGFVPPNAEGVKGAIASLRTAAPDLKLTIEEIVASGEKTCAYHSSGHSPWAVHGPPRDRANICNYGH